MPPRWHNAIVHAADPVFLLNRHQRIDYVNPAWEALTGLPGSDVLGLVCRKLRSRSGNDLAQELQSTMAPPPEVRHGTPLQVRRRTPLELVEKTGSRWWDIYFLPLRGAEGVLGIVGRITVVPVNGLLAEQPLPEGISAIRQRHVERFTIDESGLRSGGRRVREQIQLAAQTRAGVVVVGERGAGKHWTARAIHQLSGQREQPFIRLDCHRLADNVVAETIFGDRGLLRRQRFGTIYLCQPDSFPGDLQAAIADMMSASAELDDGPRFITGFCDDFKNVAAPGRLAPALAAMLGPIVIELPPLRQRTAALPQFVDIFLQHITGTESTRTVSPDALQILLAHDWPGNLHELFQVLATASRHTVERIEVADLPYYLRAAPPPPARALPLDAILEQTEKRLIMLAMRIAQGNKTKAAEMLAIWRPRLLRRLEAFNFAEWLHEPAGGADQSSAE